MKATRAYCDHILWGNGMSVVYKVSLIYIKGGIMYGVGSLFLYGAITAGLLLLGMFILRNYLWGYLTQKGKQLAEKEDIAEITKLIEGVKSEFSNENAKLQADLQRLSSVEISHRQEERNAIVTFYHTCNRWLYAILETTLNAYHRGSTQELSERRIHIDKFYGEASIAQAMIRLLVKDEEIITVSHKLFQSMLEFKIWADTRMLKVQLNLEHLNRLTERFLIISKDFENNKAWAHELANKEQELKKETDEIVKEYYDNRTKACEKIFMLDYQFTCLVKAYLTK